MKIIVVEFDSSGGLIHYAYQLCSVMAEQGVNVRLVTGTDYELDAFPHTFPVDKILHLWARHSSTRIPSGKTIFFGQFWHKFMRLLQRGTRAFKLIAAWITLSRSLIRQKPDIVQFSEIHFFFEALFLWRLRRHKIHLCQICHEFEHREERGILKPFITRLNGFTFKQFSAIINFPMPSLASQVPLKSKPLAP